MELDAVCVLSGETESCDSKCPMIKRCYPEYKDESRSIQDELPTPGS